MLWYSDFKIISTNDSLNQKWKMFDSWKVNINDNCLTPLTFEKLSFFESHKNFRCTIRQTID
jgi:hypothetical protein